jgi:hypothetical protein
MNTPLTEPSTRILLAADALRSCHMGTDTLHGLYALENVLDCLGYRCDFCDGVGSVFTESGKYGPFRSRKEAVSVAIVMLAGKRPTLEVLEEVRHQADA